ncbi:CHASE domain-containing protein [Vogesella urethralis]|uniref:CHASE domain-containing protein n=1 Tax=Vogesella urethralis TaxID=2592656 RepID=UPI001187279F|nr:CHASE domain-containing protein [Vogesella urethralis]
MRYNCRPLTPAATATMRARDSLPASTGLFRFRQWPQMVRELPWRVRVSFLLLWALLSIAILVAAILLTEESRQQQFDATTLHIKKTLEERLLICETAVYGFSELSAANYGMDRQRFRQYAQGIGSRYPYIYLMGFQPKVSLAERENFEASISFQRYQPFFIKDYQSDSDNGWLDNQLWRPATARPFYVPLINAEPAAANRYAFMQGLDILQDRLLGPAVQRAMRSTDIEITRPYRMRDGGHGFGFVKAIYAEGIPPTSPEERMAAAIGIITVGVRAEALLAMQDSSMQPYGIRLLPATPGSQVPAIVLQQSAADSEPAGAIARRLFPPRQSELSIERDYFPYKLSVSRPSSPGHIPWYLYGLAAGASALINALLLLIAASQHNERMQRDRYHDALNRERQQAMITLESIDDAVLVTNRELQVEYLNPKAALLLNTHGPSAVGCQLSELWQLRFDLAREAVLDPLQTCLRSGQQVTLPENAYIEQGGKVFYVEGTISPLPDQGGALRGLVITFRDMAPLRQRMAEALERSEARLKQHQAELARVARINTLGEMTSGIAHEINQPLSAIVSYNEACLGLLEDEEPDRILLISALRSSVKQAQRAGHIVKKLREFVASKQADLVPVDLNQAVLNVVTLIEPELRDHQVQVKTDLAASLPLVFADTIQVEQVILNLCKNAMEAMMDQPGEHRLFLYSELRGSRVRVGVRDNGPGMSEEVLGRIFQPFFSSKAQGMGLGLTISHTIIENMDGVLSASNLPTGGAEFYFELPVMNSSYESEGVSA